MAVEMYKDVDTGVVSAKDTIIDDLVDVFRNDDDEITFEEANEAAIEMFANMVEAGALVKVE